MRRPLVLRTATVLAGAAAALTLEASYDGQQEFSVHARKYEFAPARIEVQQDEIVKVTLEADDIPHSFTIDAYRISRRATPGQPTVFEFRADKQGTFPIYCSLANDDGCRQMRAELVVRTR